MALIYKCDCCERENPPNLRKANKFLMGDWIDHICFDCMDIWYDGGETDPAVIKAAVLAKAAKSERSEAPR